MSCLYFIHLFTDHGRGRFRADANAASGGGGPVRVPRVEEDLGSAHMCSVCSWPPGEPHGAGPRIVRAARLKPHRAPHGESQPAAPRGELREGKGVGPGGRPAGSGVLLRLSPSPAAWCLMFREV